MVREISLIRGLGAPAKEMSFRHHLALFKDLSCLLLPTIARHCPRLPAKKMSQALVASQYGRGSRGPGRVPRAAPRQPGCTVEQTNHEPRSFLARGASRREFRGLHESRNHGFFLAVGAPGSKGHRKTPSGPLRPPASHCLFPGSSPASCSPLFAIVHDCSRLFAIVRHCSPKNIVLRQCPRAARSLLRWARSLGMARLRAAIARPARGGGGGGSGGKPVSLPRPPFSVGPSKCVRITSHESRLFYCIDGRRGHFALGGLE